MLAKRTSKNQVTIPKRAMEGLGAVDYFDVQRQGNTIVLKPVLISGQEDRLLKLRAKMARLGVSEADVEEAIRWARKSAG